MHDFFSLKMHSQGYNALGCCCSAAISITPSLFLSAAGLTKALSVSLFDFLSYQSQCDVSAIKCKSCRLQKSTRQAVTLLICLFSYCTSIFIVYSSDIFFSWHA